VRINYQERKDLNGVKIPKGHWVLGQRMGVQNGEQVLEEAGVDLGEVLECVILKCGTQYSYVPDKKKRPGAKRCSSQVITDPFNETPIGSDLKKNCKEKGACPRRAEGIDKDDKCSCQHVVFVRLPAGTKLPDGSDCPVAMLYIKGESFIPFKDFVGKELAGLPVSFITTVKMTPEEKYHGSVVYFVLNFAKGSPVPAIEFRQSAEMVQSISKDLDTYKAQQAQKLTALPLQRGVTGELLPPVAGNMRELPAAFAEADDDIAF
jgi:hypothetical protein